MIAIPHYISPEEYLEIERQSPVRHEYRRGLVYAMAGGTDNHDRIAFNFLSAIDRHFGDDSECRFYSGNVKVNYAQDFYYYPDAFVTCDSRDREDRYLKRYPKLIVEVLSSSTQAFDTGDKFDDYKQLDSLEEYVLISQTEMRVECRRRVSHNSWDTVVYETGLSKAVQTEPCVVLQSIGLALPLAKLYRGLDG